ncbi:uncharacterized protein [Musca autumnalis]|uniref:uncharacterized protein n=1 Tax=Musca autumnalis TaxID=221902 RepID=UPI003CFA8196
MRTFIVLCFVAVAYGGHAGYNYQPSASLIGGSFAGFSSPSFSAPFYSTPSFTAPSFTAPSFTTPSFTAPSYSPPAPAVELTKEFYTFSAPEDEFNDPIPVDQYSSALKKSIRVIFIKGPENRGLENAALALAKQAGQQQTAIYVLNKQTDLGDLANKLNNLGTSNNKRPEVHFIKYRTPEDAVNAQLAIQSQYDLLGGNSHNINGGIAPVINFASQAPVSAGSVSVPQNSYLPSSIFSKRF